MDGIRRGDQNAYLDVLDPPLRANPSNAALFTTISLSLGGVGVSGSASEADFRGLSFKTTTISAEWAKVNASGRMRLRGVEQPFSQDFFVRTLQGRWYVSDEEEYAKTQKPPDPVWRIAVNRSSKATSIFPRTGYDATAKAGWTYLVLDTAIENSSTSLAQLPASSLSGATVTSSQGNDYPARSYWATVAGARIVPLPPGFRQLYEFIAEVPLNQDGFTLKVPEATVRDAQAAPVSFPAADLTPAKLPAQFQRDGQWKVSIGTDSQTTTGFSDSVGEWVPRSGFKFARVKVDVQNVSGRDLQFPNRVYVIDSRGMFVPELVRYLGPHPEGSCNGEAISASPAPGASATCWLIREVPVSDSKLSMVVTLAPRDGKEELLGIVTVPLEVNLGPRTSKVGLCTGRCFNNDTVFWDTIDVRADGSMRFNLRLDCSCSGWGEDASGDTFVEDNTGKRYLPTAWGDSTGKRPFGSSGIIRPVARFTPVYLEFPALVPGASIVRFKDGNLEFSDLMIRP